MPLDLDNKEYNKNKIGERIRRRKTTSITEGQTDMVTYKIASLLKMGLSVKLNNFLVRVLPHTHPSRTPLYNIVATELRYHIK